MNHIWIRHGESKIWWPAGIFFFSEDFLSHDAWSPSRDTDTLKTSLSHWSFFPHTVFLLCKLVSLDLLWVNPLKKGTSFSSESLRSYHEQTKLIKNMSPQAFTLCGIYLHAPNSQQTPFLPVNFPFSGIPRGWHWGQHPPRGTGHEHPCRASALPRGNSTPRTELSPHQVDGLVFIKHSIARPLLTQELENRKARERWELKHQRVLLWPLQDPQARSYHVGVSAQILPTHATCIKH